MKSAREPLAVFLLLAAVGTAVWVHRIHLDPPDATTNLPWGDSFLYFYPSTVFLHRELRAGHLPLWNPYQMAGQPYLALHVPAALYPPHLLLAWALPPLRALEAEGVLHFCLAGFFTWLFAGRIGLRGAPRLAAAVVYMLSGALLVGVYMPPFLAVPAWLPALAWALHGMLSERRAIWAVALALCASLAFLAGHSQAFVYEVEFAALYAAFGLFAVAGGRHVVRILALGALSGALVVALAAPQLLSALELARDGVRGLGGLAFAEAAQSSVTPAALLEGLSRPVGPALLGHSGLAARTLVTLPILALPLFVCGLAVRERRAHVVAFGLFAALVGLLMLGWQGPLFRFYFALPLGDAFRNPARMAFLYLFLASILVGAGIEGVGRLLRASPRTGWSAGAVTGVLLLGVAADSYLGTRLSYVHPATSDPGPGTAPTLIRFLAARWERGRGFVERSLLWDTRALYKSGMMNGVFVVPDYEPNMPSVYQRYFGIPEWPLWHGALYVALDFPRGASDEVKGRLLDLMSVRYYAINREKSPNRVASLLEFAGGPVQHLGWMDVSERASAVPRVYAVRRALRVPTFEAAMTQIGDSSFDPHADAVVTDPDAAGVAQQTWPAGGGEDTARFASYEPSRVEVDAACPEGCLLVLTDLYYPGWRVRVDGSEREILRVNGIFRGVELDAGSHRVAFRFAPRSFRIGSALCAAALLAAAAIAAGSWKRAGGP
jgi:hypothetical protein